MKKQVIRSHDCGNPLIKKGDSNIEYFVGFVQSHSDETFATLESTALLADSTMLIFSMSLVKECND